MVSPCFAAHASRRGISTNCTWPEYAACTSTLPGGADYAATTETFLVDSADGSAVDITLSAINDQLVEPTTESFEGVELQVADNGGADATVGDGSQAQTVDVGDNDAATVSIDTGTATVGEDGTTDTVAVTLSLDTDGTGDAKLAVPVRVNLNPASDDDYSAGEATFAVNSLNDATVDITVAAATATIDQANDSIAIRFMISTPSSTRL